MAFPHPGNLSLDRPGLMQVSNNPRPLDNFKSGWPSSHRFAPKSLPSGPPKMSKTGMNPAFALKSKKQFAFLWHWC